MSGDHYKTLGVSHSAQGDEIRRAYKSKAKLLHPDVNKAKDALQQFQSLKEAYETLSDPNKKFIYDQRFQRWNNTVRNNTIHTHPYAFVPNYEQWRKSRNEYLKEKIRNEEAAYQEKLNRIRASRYYHLNYIIGYIKILMGYFFSLTILAFCIYICLKTHPMFLFFMSPCIAGALFLLKWSSDFLKEHTKLYS